MKKAIEEVDFIDAYNISLVEEFFDKVQDLNKKTQEFLSGYKRYIRRLTEATEQKDIEEMFKVISDFILIPADYLNDYGEFIDYFHALEGRISAVKNN